MKDTFGNEITERDIVFVASLADGVKPNIEKCRVVEILYNKVDGTPRKEPLLKVRPVNTKQTPVGITERNVSLRVAVPQPRDIVR